MLKNAKRFYYSFHGACADLVHYNKGLSWWKFVKTIQRQADHFQFDIKITKGPVWEEPGPFEARLLF